MVTKVSYLQSMHGLSNVSNSGLMYESLCDGGRTALESQVLLEVDTLTFLHPTLGYH